MDEAAAPAPPPARFSWVRVLAAAIPLAAVIWWIVWQYRGELEAGAVAQRNANTFARMLGTHEERTQLDEQFADADGDLVADLPDDESQWLRPEELTFSYVASSDPSESADLWQPVLDALAAAAGRPVRSVRYADAGEQLRALHNGQLHVTAFGTGAVPQAVNEAGFVPAVCLADASGQYAYTMKIIVPADSPIQKPADLRGRRMTFTRPRSNSGYKAALVMLLEEERLQPERDYQWGFSYGHETSIRGIVEGEFEAASVASDLLDAMIARGEAPAAAIRAIYESPPYPPAALGYSHRLAPEIAAAVRQALLDLNLENTELADHYGKTAVRLAPISYRDDWAPVRTINAAVRSAREALDTRR